MIKLAVVFVTVWFQIATSNILITRNLNREIQEENVNKDDNSWVSIKATQDKIKALAGEPIEIECEASGTPAPYIKFYRGDLDIKEDNIFISKEFQSGGLARATGKYHSIAMKTEIIFCQATSGSKTSLAKIEIIVAEPKYNLMGNNIWWYKIDDESKNLAPKITFFDTMYVGQIGNTATLPCVANPKDAEITWLNSTRYPIENVVETRRTVTPLGNLQIKSISWSDMGSYICVARNNYGEDTITTFLYPMLDDN